MGFFVVIFMLAFLSFGLVFIISSIVAIVATVMLIGIIIRYLVYYYAMHYHYFKVIGSISYWKGAIPFVVIHEWFKLAKTKVKFQILFISHYVLLVAIFVMSYINVTAWLEIRSIPLENSLFLAVFILFVIFYYISSIILYKAKYQVIRKYNGRKYADIFIVIAILFPIAIPFYLQFYLIPRVNLN